jgi:integrase
MARPSKPWFREHDGWWYVTINGEQRKLARGEENRDEALKEFHRLLGTDEPAPARISVAKCFDLFLDRCKRETESFDWYKFLLEPAARSFGRLPVHKLKVHHVSHYLDKKGYGDTSKSKVIGAVKSALNHCVQQGYLDRNPIAHMKKPSSAVRDRILTLEERELIFSSIKDRAFQDYLFAVSESGARPGEIRKLTKDNVNLDLGVIVLTKHKTAKKTKKPRIIYPSDKLRELVARLIEKYPDGSPIFRNRNRRPWTKNAVQLRFRRLRKKFPQLEGVISYTFRHSFATDALEKGLPEAAVAELMGHSGTATLHRHYSKLSQKIDYLKGMAQKATASGASALPAAVPANDNHPGSEQVVLQKI